MKAYGKPKACADIKIRKIKYWIPVMFHSKAATKAYKAKERRKSRIVITLEAEDEL